MKEIESKFFNPTEEVIKNELRLHQIHIKKFENFAQSFQNEYNLQIKKENDAKLLKEKQLEILYIEQELLNDKIESGAILWK